MTEILSRPVRIASVGTAGGQLAVRASEAELAVLAEANGLEAVTRFEAQLDMRHERGATLRVTGTLSADVVYRCVVTLEPVPGRVEEPVDVRFRDAPADETQGGEISLEAQDPPEPAPGGVAEVGAILAELFTLGLDPYPRAPGAQLAEDVSAPGEAGPFAALARLKGPAERS